MENLFSPHERITLARKRAGLTTQQLAKRIGCTNGMVSSWETGRKTPCPKNRKALEREISSFGGPKVSDWETPFEREVLTLKAPGSREEDGPQPRLEVEVQACIVKALRKIPGVLVYKNGTTPVLLANQSGAQWRAHTGLGAGTPDLIVLAQGKMLGLEVKAEHGRLSDNQKNVQRLWRSVGIVYEQVKSIEDAVSVLKKHTPQLFDLASECA